jgi:hypothetical protein
MAASDRSAASANHQVQLSESSGSRSPALGLRRGCSVPPWFCGELDQALTAFAGEGIGDGGAALLEGGVGLAWWRRPERSASVDQTPGGSVGLNLSQVPRQTTSTAAGDLPHTDD